MTYTRSDKPPVYLEFPDFGYGPASTLLSLIRPVADQYDWHVVSTGGAAAHVLAELPQATLHDLDTFPSGSWAKIGGTVPAGALVISVTNPGFAAWAIRHGYRVGVVDTLDWMWGHDQALNDAEFHIVQSYFASTPSMPSRREYVRPIVDTTLWPVKVRSVSVTGAAVIGFGGMHLPGADAMVADYVRWFLRAALPVLIDHAGSTSVTIAGGRSDLALLVPDEWAAHPAVQVRNGLGQAEYARVAQRTQHLLCSPGLASIYECATSGLSPLWQPGFSMSMLLQSRQLAVTGYQHIASWPWTREITDHIAKLPEDEGVRCVVERIESTVRVADPAGELLTKQVVQYIESSGKREAFAVPFDAALPDAVTLFAAHLRRLA